MAKMMTANSTQAAKENSAFFGHPKGVGFIVFTEIWERFSFYGMQALLVLYMANYLFQPGNIENVIGFSVFHNLITAVFGELSVKALASQVFGLYVAFVYFTPIIGGLIGDRWIGRKAAVLLGAGFMVFGHFMMASEPLFLFALIALIIGSGFLKGNLAAQVGQLYGKNDQRRDDGYVLYNLAINIGATLAPLVCGTVGMVYGWHYGFGIAGLGMIIGCVIYVWGLRDMPHQEKFAVRTASAGALKKGDGAAILAIVGLFVVAAFFWTAQLQVYNTYDLWVQDSVDLFLFGKAFQVPWLHALDSFAVLLFGPMIIVFWTRQRTRETEPSDLVKIVIGCAIVGFAFSVLALGAYVSGDAKVSLVWPFIFHMVCAVGFLYVGPVIMAVVSRTAPDPVNSMMVSAYYLSLFVGGMASGWLGRFYEVISATQFWLLHAALLVIGGGLIVIFYKPLIRYLRLEEHCA